VEVLVALSVMAVIAGMAWQGIDAMARSRDIAQASAERTLRLGTVLAQWEHDLQAVLPTGVVPALRFDGATTWLTREAPGGVQLVAWTWRDGSWWRWAAPAATATTDLRAHWERAQWLVSGDPGAVRMIEGLSSVQLYFHRDNAWTNAQSTGDGPPAAAAGAAETAAGAAAPPPTAERLPNAVRLVLALEPGPLTRDLLLPPQP
jgi:general secretion pathway protein J